jgi:uncharacterized protein involved in exopolysaccharide biosynthesis
VNPLGPEAPAATALANPFADLSGVRERHWPAMLAIFAAGALASLAVWWLTPQRYFAAATVVVSGPLDSTGVVGRTAEAETLPVTEVLVAQVLSDSNLARLISEFSLYPELEGVTTTEAMERARAQVSIRELKRLDRGEPDALERAYSIGFEATTPEAALAVANRLASSLAEIDAAKRLRQQELAISLLHSQLERTQAELDQRNQATATFRRQNRGLLPSDLRASAARQRELGVLRDKLVQLRSQETSQHPAVQNLERQIAAHQQELAALDARMARMREVEDQLASLEAAAALSREEYLGLKRELQRAELGGSLLDAQPGGRISVLNPAEPPARKVGTRWRYLALGLAASLALAFVAGVALELLHPVVLSPDDVLEIVGQPVLGWVTRIR